ncbi:MAG: 16S rRNA (guanine(966)-N(2))-methyltransferase RsmD [Burkholderiales bacterium]|nr:16S rRNA (guanine(966)-N(2))-methyltransferase RsmD [Burkholderiales bacterium]
MPPTNNRVRIIGGRHRGRVLRFPGVPGLRPTPDRVRETLFNWLGQDLSGRTTLDLYAGTGAMSVEALSRGAARAVAVDRDPGLALALESNARAIGLDAIEVHRGDARRHLERETRDFDVIFADPPYGEDPWPWLLPACAARLSPGGVVYAEAGRALEAPEGLVLVRHGRAGQVHYHLYARC